MNFIEELETEVLRILTSADFITPATKNSIKIEYWITFGNFYSPEWRSLKLNKLVRTKNEEGLQIRVRFDDKDPTIISEFKLVQMPGCCGICISTGVEVKQQFRKLGLNKLFNKFRIQIAKECGYTILMCIDLQDNIGELKTLEANGWKHLLAFTNYRTNNKLNLTIKEL